MCNSSNTLWKIYFVYDFLVHTNLFIPSHFWTTHANFDNCCQHRMVTCWKKIQRYISTFLALKYCGGISLKSFCYLYEVVGIDLWCKWNFVVFCSKLTNYYRLSLSVSMKSVSLFYINAQSHIEIYANNAIIITCWELWHYWLSSLSNPRRFSVGGEPL